MQNDHLCLLCNQVANGPAHSQFNPSFHDFIPALTPFVDCATCQSAGEHLYRQIVHIIDDQETAIKFLNQVLEVRHAE